jgi:hypothetical protein
MVRGSMVPREITLEPFFSMLVIVPTAQDTMVGSPFVNSSMATINEHEEPVL